MDCKYDVLYVESDLEMWIVLHYDLSLLEEGEIREEDMEERMCEEVVKEEGGGGRTCSSQISLTEFNSNEHGHVMLCVK